MATKYCYDAMGNRYPTLSKDEIEKSIGAGGIRECVLTSEILFNGEYIPYKYNGIKPSDELIVMLLECSLNFDKLPLSNSDIATLLSDEFKLHIYLCETDVYITNGHSDAIYVYNSAIGYRHIYQYSTQEYYFVKANKPISNIKYLSKNQFNNLDTKDENTLYIVEDAEYAVESTKNVTESIGNYPLSQIFSNYESTNKYLRNGTVRKADNATTAGYADEAGRCNEAARATYADSANNASNATNATNAVTSEKTKELLSKNFKSWASGLTIPTDSEVEVLNVDFRDGKGHLLMCNFDATVNSTTQHISAIIFVRSISTSAIQYYTCIPNGQYGIINIAVRPRTDGLYMQNATSGSTLKLMSIEIIDIDEQ